MLERPAGFDPATLLRGGYVLADADGEPDVLLIALSLSIPERAFWYAILSSLGSVLGSGTGFASLSPRIVASGEITFPCSRKGNRSVHRSPAPGEVLTGSECASAARFWSPSRKEDTGKDSCRFVRPGFLYL